MWLYDIFDPEGYNNLFVLTLISEPIVLAGCHVPTSPENRTFKITAFYRWLELISKVYTKSKSKWSLYPCDIKPGTLPFAINIESLTREPVDRDSTDNISPGAYLILTDGARSAPEVLKDTLDSKELNLFSRVVGPSPSPIPGDVFCNITGAALTAENGRNVQIIRDNGEESIWSILLGRPIQFPTDLNAPQNYLSMASSLQPHFDKFSFGIDVDDNYRIVQFARPSADFDVSKAGTLKIPESRAMPFEQCLRLHFHFCLRMYLASPPPGVPTYTVNELNFLQEEIGLYEASERLPELSDPVWNSPLGREVLRSAMTERLSHLP